MSDGLKESEQENVGSRIIIFFFLGYNRNTKLKNPGRRIKRPCSVNNQFCNSYEVNYIS